MNHQTVPCKHCRFENRPDTNFCAGCGTRFSKGNSLAMIGRSIFRKSVVRNGIILAYVATPILIAVWLYTVTSWVSVVPGSTCTWGGSLICGENIPFGFVLELMILGLGAAIAYLVIGLAVVVVLRVGTSLLKVETNLGETILAGMGIGSAAATATLAVCCVVGYFLVC